MEPEGLGEQVGDGLAFVSDGEGALAGAVHDVIEGETQGVGDGGVEVLDLHFVFDDFTAFLVGFAIDVAAFDATAEHDG